jgi:hypothetical protein
VLVSAKTLRHCATARVLVATVIVLGAAAPTCASPFIRLPRIVDSANRPIGTVVADTPNISAISVWRRESDVIASLQVRADGEGFQPVGRDATFYYETPDCTGTAYLSAGPEMVRVTISPPETTSSDAIVIYAGNPLQMRMITSRKFGSESCQPYGPQLQSTGPVRVLDLSTLVPPFFGSNSGSAAEIAGAADQRDCC